MIQVVGVLIQMLDEIDKTLLRFAGIPPVSLRTMSQIGNDWTVSPNSALWRSFQGNLHLLAVCQAHLSIAPRSAAGNS